MAYTATRRAIQSRLWSPRDLGASLCLWLDAGDPKTLTMNGSTVSSWIDKSQYGNTVSNATGTAQPGLTVTSGITYTTWNGTSNILNSATVGTNFPLGASPRSIFAVASPSSGISDGSIIAYGQAATGHNGAAISLICNSGNSIWLTAFNIDVQTTSTPSYVPQIFSAVATGVTTTLSTNGTQVATGAQALVTASFHNITVGGGYWNAANGLWWKGGIAQIIFINAIVSLVTQQKCEGYLAWKCGLQNLLPQTHPYYLAPPRVAA
jgi:hypothetical protein